MDQESVVDYVVCIHRREHTVVCGVYIEGTKSGVYVEGTKSGVYVEGTKSGEYREGRIPSLTS